VSAVVSRGGRPDLAGERLGDIRAPTLLIVGSADSFVLEVNQDAATRLTCRNELAVVPGATHLFEEPGALEQVASLAAAWFTRVFGARVHTITREREETDVQQEADFAGAERAGAT
jgi:alpha-beta hydrolase superfamily lysophospholipase